MAGRTTPTAWVRLRAAKFPRAREPPDDDPSPGPLEAVSRHNRVLPMGETPIPRSNGRDSATSRGQWLPVTAGATDRANSFALFETSTVGARRSSKAIHLP